MRNTRGAVALGFALVLLCAAGRLSAQTISSLTVNKNAGNSADNFTDGTFASFQRTSVVAINTSNTTSFTTRYSFVVGTDTGVFTSQSNSLTSDYRINFNVTTPGAYVLNVTTHRDGALTLVDDGTASASAAISGVTGTQTGGTLSGSLGLADPPDLSSNSSSNSAFDSGNVVATISGTSNGVAKPHELDFSWTSSCNSGSGLTGGDECAVRGGIAITYSGETAGDYPGSGGRTAANDGHFVSVTLTSLCGNGTIDAGVGETCDQGAGNGTTGSCCQANCTIRPSGQTCRPVAGDCDVAETCNGTNPTCPADTFAANTVVCRAASAGMECDFSEKCTGGSAACPADTVQPNGFVCRASAGDCDLAETCNGVSKLCPMDIKSMAVCRPQNGACDVAESCNGVSNNCPADGFAGTSTVCRGAVDTCDQAENCPGGSPTCPPDVIKPNAAACPSDGNPCTVDQCNGVSTACQHPPGNAGATCRADTGACDVAETCTGASATCPTDGFEPSGTTCTNDGNPCTVDQCDGSNNCTHNAGNAGTQCRGAVDLCDVAEQCDGSSTTCPPDVVATNSTVCRAASPGQLCDQSETCDGVSTACPADEVVPNGTECRASAGDCDVAESCDGVSKFCPGDAFAPSSTECRGSAGDCDPAENCTGSSATCPPDVLTMSGTPCRVATDVCDITENCTGSSPTCPVDVTQPDGSSCSDSLFCNGSEMCASGVCQSGTSPCTMGQNCDEMSDLCFTGNCPSNAVMCRTAAKSLLVVKDKMDNTKDKLIWKWIKGASTTQTEFADPTNTAAYALCFYAGPSESLIGDADVSPGLGWTIIPNKGFKYKDPGGSQDGITKVIVKGSTNNKSKALVKGKGAGLPDFTVPVANGDLPVIVQLRNNSTGICWESSFATPIRNQAGLFKAKTP